MEQAPTSVLDAWSLYEQVVRSNYTSSKASAILAQAKSALFRYTLSGLGFPHPQGKGLTLQEAEAARMFMQQLPVERLAQAALVQQQVFDVLLIPKQTQRTYRHALNRFLQWCSEQSWCTCLLEKQPMPRGRQKQETTALPRITKRQRTNDQGKKLYRYEYSLEQVSDNQTPDKLKRELETFYRFRTAMGTAYRIPSVKEVTASKELELIRLLLGWLHYVKQKPLDELSLQQLLPLVSPIPKPDPTKRTQQQTKPPHPALTLMNDYLDWLQKEPSSTGENTSLPPRSQSHHTRLQIIKLFLVISKFIYWEVLHQQSEPQYKQLSVVQALRKELSLAQKQALSQVSTNLVEQKSLKLSQFQELVQLLRQECLPQRNYSTHTGRNKTRLTSRSLSAIALSYQRFLLAALMSYFPPQRPYYYWALLIRQPSSQEQEQATTQSLEFSGFLSQAEGKWVLHWRQDVRQTNSTPMQELEIPNEVYADGRHFYDYLQEWLTSFSYEGESLPGLRSVFQPTHDFFFTKRNGQPYTRANEFKHLLRTPAYRQLGKAPTPITIRLLFRRGK